MKKTTVSITFDDEKLSALKMYLAQKNIQVETELEKSLDTLYAKTVPAGVRDFLEMRSGNAPAAPAAKPKKPKSSPSSAVGSENEAEVKTNEPC